MRECDQCTHWLKTVQISSLWLNIFPTLTPLPDLGYFHSSPGFLQQSPHSGLSASSLI